MFRRDGLIADNGTSKNREGKEREKEKEKKGPRLHDLRRCRRRRRTSLNEISGCVYVLSSLMKASQKLVTKVFRGNERRQAALQERGAGACT